MLAERAFWDLSTDRPFGALGGCGSIPWSAIDRYATRVGLDGDAFERFERLIRTADRVYLARMAELAPPSPPKPIP